VHPDALAAHRRLYCAYKQLRDRTYDLLTELYRAYLKEGAEAQLELLRRYECADAPSKDDFDKGARALLAAFSH
jgi:protein-disulfide isomerase